jgi:TonB family protein
MFDRLIVSEPAGAQIKSRRRYFVLSTFFVGAAVAIAMVISIYAADYGLGTNNFEVAMLVAPVVQTPQAQPEPPRQQAPVSPTKSVATVPTRQANIQNVNETPVDTPKVSSVPNTQKARPQGTYTISKIDSDPAPGYVAAARDPGPSSGPGLLAVGTPAVGKDPATAPPAAKPPTPPARPVTKSLGVVNGLAQSLPKPHYPAAALAVNIEGKVDVQVLIDETGRVVSAKAVSGNALLKPAAEQAARNARFSPTMLSNVPVKVTGLIVYNFSRS